MKRIYTLLTMLLMVCAGAEATTNITVDTSNPLTSASQISTEKYYVLFNQGRNGYVNVNTSDGKILLTTTLPTSSDAALLPYIIRFVPNTAAKSEGDAYQIKFYDGTFMQWQSNGNNNYVSTTMGYGSSNNEGYLPVYNSSYFYFQVYKNGTSRDFYFNGNSETFTFQDSYITYGEYQIYEATCSDFQEIEYNYEIGGNTTSNAPRSLLTVKNATVAIPTPTAMTSLPHFTSVSSAPTASSDGSAISFTLVENYPFDVTTLEAGSIPESAPLYRLKGAVGITPKYIKRSGSAVYYKSDETINDDDYFCITGNNIAGFRIYNKGAGASVNLGSDTPVKGTAPALTANDHIWRLYKNGNKFGFQQLKTGSTSLTNAYLCDVSNVFTYWLSANAELNNDNGAKMDCERVTFDVTDEYYVRIGSSGEYVLKGTNTTTYNSGATYNTGGLGESAALTLDEIADNPTYVSEPITVKYYYTANDAEISVGTSTGTYYTGNGAAIERGADSWGKTWKSDETVNGEPLLVLSAGTGMHSSNGDIYTGKNEKGEGYEKRYTLTAAEGYVITSYSINGVANNTGVIIKPCVRKSETATEGASLATALTVSNLDLNSVSFTLNSSTSTEGYLSNLDLRVTLALSSTKTYTPIVENGTTGYIGYKHTDTKARKMMFMKADGTGVLTSETTATTLLPAPATAGIFCLEYNATDRAYYLKVFGTNNYVYAKDVSMSYNRTMSSNAAALAVATLPVSGDRSAFQWTITDGGTYASSSSYYIRPKLNTYTAIAVQTDGASHLSFYDTEIGYGFAHAFIIDAWEYLTNEYITTNNVYEKLELAGNIGYPKTTNENTVSLVSLKKNFTGESPVYNEDNYESLVSKFQSYITTSDVVLPPTNGFYRIKGYATNKYAKAGTITAANVNGDNDAASLIPNTENTETDGSDIWLYDATNHLINYKNGLGTICTRAFAALSKTKETATFAHSTCSATTDINKWGVFEIRSNYSGSKVWYSDESNVNRNQANTDAKCEWVVEAVPSLPVTISAARYATLYAPVALEIPTGVKAFAGTVDKAKRQLTMHRIEDVIPANTAVVLKLEDDADAGTYNFNITTAGSFVGENSLQGTTAAQTYNDEFVLGVDSENSENIGFFKLMGSTVLPGFKAYLPSDVLGDEARSITVVWDDETTGISDAVLKQKEESRKQMFDLQGRRVSNPQRGLYIVNGHKIVIK